MKNSDSTEMDRLLRRHFRRNGETLLDGSGNTQESKSTAHLDADELNAYAEGALPEVARSRYFAHLADCNACRKLVTELTLASGVVSEERRAKVAEPSPSKSWREWLASLLSPPVLRYGVPALALTAIIIIAIIAMRARREESYVAQNKEATRNSALQSSASSNSAAEPSITTTENHANSNTASSNTDASLPQQAQTQPVASATPLPSKTKTEENSPNASPSGGAKATAAQPNILDKKQDEVEQEAKSGGVITSTPAPAPVLSKPAITGTDDTPKREEQRKPKAPEKDADETVVVMNNAGAATANQAENSEAPRDRGRRVASRSVQSLPMNRPAASKSASADEITEKESSSETRSISGHRFRKQGNAWVDTAYNSSRQTINIARGSEQYRALLADEPGLRAITQQLGGEVIVVWGKKAYRFY